MKILLVRNDNIGDLICTTPAIEALRKKFHKGQIDIVVNSLNACVVEKNPFLNKIYIYTKPKHKKNISDKIKAFLGKCRVLFNIFNEHYDIVIVFRSSYSSSSTLFAKFAMPKRVICVQSKNTKNRFVTDEVFFDTIPHEVLVCFAFLKPLGVYYNGEKTLFVPKNKFENYKNFIFFHVSSRIKENCLSFEKVTEILKFLMNRFKKLIITSEDLDFGVKISTELKIPYLRTTCFEEVADYLWCAKALVTLDGGIMHLGPALGIKTFVIFGKTDQIRWKPWGDMVEVIQDSSKKAENIHSILIFNKFIEFIEKYE